MSLKNLILVWLLYGCATLILLVTLQSRLSQSGASTLQRKESIMRLLTPPSAEIK